MEAVMSVQEKRAWIYGLTAIVVPAVYFAIVLRPGTDVDTVAYVRPLLLALVFGVVLNIVIDIVTSVGAPKDAGRTDERDRQIGRLGSSASFYAISIVAIVPLGLAMAKAPYFWIASTLYLAYIASAIASSVVRIVAYRRGI
jgi:hypothetical protein